MPNLNKKPTKLKVMQGTARHDREVENELEFDEVLEIPKAPKTLKGEGIIEWNNRVTELRTLGMLSQVYLRSLEMYCIGVNLMCEASEELNKDVPTDEKKQRQRRYWQMQLNDAFKIVTTIASRFGFTPSDKAKISMPESKENNEFFD